MKLFRILTVAALALATSAAAAPPTASRLKTAVFAGGCFWSMEKGFEHLPGVTAAVSGYTGGPERNPTYEQVSSETTGHVEAVKVTYDPAKISYRALTDRFLRMIDPTDAGGMFCDRGPSYRSAVFVASAQERKDAQAALAAAAVVLRKPVAVPVRNAAVFWPAEAYHQDFWRTNAAHYERYRIGCGRDLALKRVWGGR